MCCIAVCCVLFSFRGVLCFRLMLRAFLLCAVRCLSFGYCRVLYVVCNGLCVVCGVFVRCCLLICVSCVLRCDCCVFCLFVVCCVLYGPIVCCLLFVVCGV